LFFLKRFMAEYPNHGFALKAGYVQHAGGFAVRYLSSENCDNELNDILHQLLSGRSSAAFSKSGVATKDVFHYLILQPRMISNNESKVILYNGKAQYICSGIAGKPGVTNKKSSEEIFSFVEQAWSALNAGTYGAFHGDSVSRVDVFIDNSDNLVVNEFENIDANFLGPGISEEKTVQFLTDYYVQFLRNALLQHGFV